MYKGSDFILHLISGCDKFEHPVIVLYKYADTNVIKAAAENLTKRFHFYFV